MPAAPGPPRRIFERTSSREQARALAAVLRQETVGGLLLLIGAAVALGWANSPWQHGYTAFTTTEVGPAVLHLHLTLAAWAADGLLAIFFFVAGLELKRELVHGELRVPSRAALPVVAAVGGMIVPALCYLAVNTLHPDGSTDGWAVPTATDIAFALAVLAVIGSRLPPALRSFLLTLAVVDDLLAILVIAAFFTSGLEPWPLVGSLAVIVLFGLLLRRGVTATWLLLPLGVVGWALMHASGIHATIAGVLLAFAVPTGPAGTDGDDLAGRFEHAWRPVSAGVAVPVFALMAAGVSVSGGGVSAALRDPVGLGVVLGLVVGKFVGVLAATWLSARFTPARLDESLSWWDVCGLSLLAGMGFTVSLLMGELAFGTGTARDDHVKVAVLGGSLVSAVLAGIVLRARDRAYRRMRYAAVAADPTDSAEPAGFAGRAGFARDAGFAGGAGSGPTGPETDPGEPNRHRRSAIPENKPEQHR